LNRKAGKNGKVLRAPAGFPVFPNFLFKRIDGIG
jgi:hypothetical protein